MNRRRMLFTGVAALCLLVGGELPRAKALPTKYTGTYVYGAWTGIDPRSLSARLSVRPAKSQGHLLTIDIDVGYSEPKPPCRYSRVIPLTDGLAWQWTPVAARLDTMTPCGRVEVTWQAAGRPVKKPSSGIVLGKALESPATVTGHVGSIELFTGLKFAGIGVQS